LNWLPRVFRNTLNGVTGAVVSIPLGLPPSQLISRRPFLSGPGLLPLLGIPKAARNASTELSIDSVDAPAAWNTTGVAELLDGMSCACAFCLTGSTLHSKPKATM